MYDQTTQWAWEEYGHAQLGDRRNVRRAVAMAEQVMRVQGGTVSSVFCDGRQREAAYDFLENDRVDADALGHAAAVASARRSRGLPFVWIAVDGTSLSFRDLGHTKDFGPIGTTAKGGTGIKVIDSVVLDTEGVPLGLGEFTWWTRNQSPNKQAGSPGVPNGKRKLEDKETRHWLTTIRNTRQTLREHAPETVRWWLIDREGDFWRLLHEVRREGDLFTIRSNVDRRLLCADTNKKTFLREVLGREPVLDEFWLDVPATLKRQARTARMQIRACSVVLDMRDNWTKKPHPLQVNAVRVSEVDTSSDNPEPLDWVLLTNHPIETSEDLALIVFGYTKRWRIEELHRTWKSGGGCIERSQLRTVARVIKWATFLASMAVRVERLKLLARTEPDRPATSELSANELRALRALKKRSVSRGKRLPSKPSIAQAVLWIAELGGYTGKSSGGPPGSITILRGLDVLRSVALGMELADQIRTETATAGSGKGKPR